MTYNSYRNICIVAIIKVACSKAGCYVTYRLQYLIPCAPSMPPSHRVIGSLIGRCSEITSVSQSQQ